MQWAWMCHTFLGRGSPNSASCLAGSAPGEGGARAAEAHGGAEDRPEQAPGAEQEAAAAALRRALAAVADRPGGDAGGIVAVKVRPSTGIFCVPLLSKLSTCSRAVHLRA